jgi:hypothetical protein
VHHPDVGLGRQTAVADLLEHLAYLLGQFSHRGELTAPVSRLLVPAHSGDRLRGIHKQWLQGRLDRGCLVAGEPSQMREAFRLDLHLAGDAAFASWGHGYELALSKGGLHLRKPLRIGGAGSVDHQESDQEFSIPWLHRQAIPREDRLRPRVTEEEELSFAHGPFSWRPLAHKVIVTQSTRGKSNRGD